MWWLKVKLDENIAPKSLLHVTIGNTTFHIE